MSTVDQTTPTRSAPTDFADFTVRVATVEEWRTVTAWGNAEGWNIGPRDAECFFAADPGGFFLGYRGERPVAAVSLVNHSDRYGVWGHYLVDPEFRGRGYGRATCRVARRHGGDRVLASDAMPEQVGNYRRSGLVPVHDTVNYVGRPVPGGAVLSGVLRAGPEHVDAITAYDREAFPAERRGFLRAWLSAAGHVGYLLVNGGRIGGYGVLRPAPDRFRVGPLTADTEQDAAVLFDALVSHLGPDDEVSVFAPRRPGDTGSFFGARGLAEQFRVVRMYQGAPPEIRAERVFAISSLELG